MKPIYLDYNATTPVDPVVVQAMLPFLGDAESIWESHFGNPSSSHAYGRAAHDAVDRSRAQVSRLLGTWPGSIVFTAGGSEASNLAIKGVVFPLLFGRGAVECAALGTALPGGRIASWLRRLRSMRLLKRRVPHVVTSAVEHPATLRPCAFLRQLGCRVTVVPVDRYGIVDVDCIKKSLEQPTALVTIMHSNNEVGTLQPIREIAAIAHERGALVHVDAAQSLGKLPVSVEELGIDFLSIAGHKLYAPKGVGALYVRDGIDLEPLIHGAGHESGRRAGTENVPYLVGLGEACRIAHESLPAATTRLRSLRDRLEQRLREGLGSRLVLNGHPEKRLPNTLNVSFLGQTGAELLQAVPEVAASTGSACHEGQVQLSPVLQAMGVSEEVGRGAVRLSVGRFTTEDEVDQAADFLLSRCRLGRGASVAPA